MRVMVFRKAAAASEKGAGPTTGAVEAARDAPSIESAIGTEPDGLIASSARRVWDVFLDLVLARDL